MQMLFLLGLFHELSEDGLQAVIDRRMPASVCFSRISRSKVRHIRSFFQ